MSALYIRPSYLDENLSGSELEKLRNLPFYLYMCMKCQGDAAYMDDDNTQLFGDWRLILRLLAAQCLLEGRQKWTERPVWNL